MGEVEIECCESFQAHRRGVDVLEIKSSKTFLEGKLSRNGYEHR